MDYSIEGIDDAGDGDSNRDRRDNNRDRVRETGRKRTVMKSVRFTLPVEVALHASSREGQMKQGVAKFRMVKPNDNEVPTISDSGSNVNVVSRKTAMMLEELGFEYRDATTSPSEGGGRRSVMFGKKGAKSSIIGYVKGAGLIDELAVLDEVAANLIAIESFTRRGMAVVYDSVSVKFMMGDKTIFTGWLDSATKLYRLDIVELMRTRCPLSEAVRRSLKPVSRRQHHHSSSSGKDISYSSSSSSSGSGSSSSGGGSSSSSSSSGSDSRRKRPRHITDESGGAQDTTPRRIKVRYTTQASGGSSRGSGGNSGERKRSNSDSGGGESYTARRVKPRFTAQAVRLGRQFHANCKHPPYSTMADNLECGAWPSPHELVTPQLMRFIGSLNDCALCAVTRWNQITYEGSGAMICAPGSVFVLDYQGKYSPLSMGCSGWLLIRDLGSGFMKVYGMKDKQSVIEAIKLWVMLMMSVGLRPRQARHDSGTVECGTEFREALALLNIEALPTPNGLPEPVIERAVQTVKNDIAAIIESTPSFSATDWLAAATLAADMRSTMVCAASKRHSATKSPYELIYNRKPRLPTMTVGVGDIVVVRTPKRLRGFTKLPRNQIARVMALETDGGRGAKVQILGTDKIMRKGHLMKVNLESAKVTTANEKRNVTIMESDDGGWTVTADAGLQADSIQSLARAELELLTTREDMEMAALRSATVNEGPINSDESEQDEGGSGSEQQQVTQDNRRQAAVVRRSSVGTDQGSWLERTRAASRRELAAGADAVRRNVELDRQAAARAIEEHHEELSSARDDVAMIDEVVEAEDKLLATTTHLDLVRNLDDDEDSDDGSDNATLETEQDSTDVSFWASYVREFGELPLESDEVVMNVRDFEALTGKSLCFDDMMATDDTGIDDYAQTRGSPAEALMCAFKARQVRDETCPTDRMLADNPELAEQWAESMAVETKGIFKVTREVSREYALWSGIKRHVTARHTKRDGTKKTRFAIDGRQEVRDGVFPDPDSLHSPAMDDMVVKMIMQYVVTFDMDLETSDVSQCFLNNDMSKARMKRSIVVEMSPYECGAEKGQFREFKVVGYGTADASMEWYTQFKAFMLGAGLEVSVFHPCIFYKLVGLTGLLLIGVATDDTLKASTRDAGTVAALAEFNRDMESRWTMTHVKPAVQIIGIDIDRSNSDGSIILTQKSEINKIVKKFFGGDRDSVPDVLTPLSPDINSTDIGCEENARGHDRGDDPVNSTEYRALLGTLSYLRMTRHDILVALSLLAERSHMPTRRFKEALYWLAAFVVKTENIGLAYHRGTHDSRDIRRCLDWTFCGDSSWATRWRGASCNAIAIIQGKLATIESRLIKPYTAPIVAMSGREKGLQSESATATEIQSTVKVCTLGAVVRGIAEELAGLMAASWDKLTDTPEGMAAPSTTCISTVVQGQSIWHSGTDPNTVLLDNASAAKVLATTTTKKPKNLRRLSRQIHFIKQMEEKKMIKVTLVRDAEQRANPLTKALMKPVQLAREMEWIQGTQAAVTEFQKLVKDRGEARTGTRGQLDIIKSFAGMAMTDRSVTDDDRTEEWIQLQKNTFTNSIESGRTWAIRRWDVTTAREERAGSRADRKSIWRQLRTATNKHADGDLPRVDKLGSEVSGSDGRSSGRTTAEKPRGQRGHHNAYTQYYHLG